MLFVVDNCHHFQTNSSVHEINTRHNNHLHTSRPSVTPAAIQSGTAYCIKIFNKLPPEISVLKNDKTIFKSALRKYILSQFFHSTEEFLSNN
jgi:hypothetical protein